MKEQFSRHITIAIIFIIITTSCATTTLRFVWKDSAYKGSHLNKILIIGVDRNPIVQGLLENEFVEQLKTRGIVAVPSRTISDEGEILDRETLLKKINELGIDSVLVTRVRDVKDAGRYETYPYIAEDNFYAYYLVCCESVSIGRDIFIETKIFDAKYDKLIWSALSETILEGPSLKYSIESFVTTVIKDLHDEKLLRY